MPPPGTFLIPIRAGSSEAGSRVWTASTTMAEKKGLDEWISLEDMAVEAHLSRSDRKSLRASVRGFSEQLEKLEGKGDPLFVGGVDGDCELVDALDGESGGGAVALDDDVRADAVLDKLLCLAEEFSREQDDRSRAVSDFGVLGAGDIDQGLCSGVDYVEQAEDGRAVVRDGRVAVGADDELVHTARAEGRGDGGCDAQARGNVAQELRRPLARVGALAEDEHRRVLHSRTRVSPSLYWAGWGGSACSLLPSWECDRSSFFVCVSLSSRVRRGRRRANFGAVEVEIIHNFSTGAEYG